MRTGKHKSYIGLLMDSAEMRAVEISGTAANPVLEASGSIALPKGLLTDGLLTDISAGASLLGRLLRENGFSSKAQLVAGAKNQNVLLRMAAMPRVPAQHLHNAIMYQAQQFIPVPVQELILDYVICSDENMPDTAEMSFLLVGAKRVFLDNIIGLAKAANRTLYEIDSAALAALRAVMTSEEAAGGFFLMANIDHETVNIIVCRDQRIVMTRTVPLSPEYLAIAGGYGYGYQGTVRETDARALARVLANDLRASIQYYTMQHNAPIPLVLLTGTCETALTFATAIQEELSIPVKRAASYPALGKFVDASYASCIALALRGWEELP